MNRRLLVLAVGVVLAASAHAAPDEIELGRDEGYPLCPGSARPEPRCLVALVSRFDEVLPARVVKKGPVALPLRRAATEPAIRYSYAQGGGSIDDYLSRTRATGLLILKGDTILVERYQYDRTPVHRMASYSMAKTITAMLVGIALDEGSIRSLDDTAAAYVPELKGTPYGETKLRHLLTMSSGVRFEETYSGFDDVATLARLSMLGESEGGAASVMPFRTRDLAPGERFRYASAETQVLGLVVRGATGRNLADYTSEKIWQPMGAEADASWQIDRGGYETAYAGFNAALRDYARLGLLLANDGARSGRPIIPAAWVREATRTHGRQFEPGHATGLFGYGYQTWILPGKEREFALRGLRGQWVFVAPKHKIVMVHTAAGGVGALAGETVSLWNGVIRSLSAR